MIATVEVTGTGLRIDLDTGSLAIHRATGEMWSEIAEIHGFPDRAWMVGRPGEDGFEDLAKGLRRATHLPSIHLLKH